MKNKSCFIKGASIVLTAIVLLFLIVTISVQLILTPKSLNRIVGTFSKEYIDGQVMADTIRLHIFKDFPYLTLSIQNGRIISGVLAQAKDTMPQTAPAKSDTLLKFKYLNISLSLPQLLSSNVNIKRINLVSPEIYAYVAPDAAANYNILKFTSDTTPKKDTEGNQENSMEVTVSRINIRDGVKITYESAPDSLVAELSLKRANIRGTFSTNINKLRFHRADISNFSIKSTKQATVNDTLHSAMGEFTLDSLDIRNLNNGTFNIAAASYTTLRMNQFVLAENFPIEINGKVKFDTTKAMQGEFDNLTLSVAKIPIVFNGDFSLHPDSLTTRNLCGKVNGMKLTDLLSHIPSNILKEKEMISSNATINIDVDVEGTYKFKTGALPSVNASFTIPESQVEFKGRESRINRLAADIRARYSQGEEDTSTVEIRKMVVDGRGIHLGAKGVIEDLSSGNPYINMSMTAKAYLDTLCKLFPATTGSQFEGTVSAEADIKSRLNNLTLYRLGNAGIKGSIKTDKTKIIIPQEGIYAILSGINIVAGSSKNTADSSIKRNMKMLATNSWADSIYIKLKDGLMVAARELRIAGHHAAEAIAMDTTKGKVLPLNGIIEAKRLDIRGRDSISLAMDKPNIRLSILPKADDASIPVMTLNAKATRMNARGLENRYSIHDGGFTIRAVLDNSEYKAQRERMNRRLDSLQKLYPQIPRDSLPGYMRAMRLEKEKNLKRGDFTGDDIDLKVDRSLGEIIRQWDIQGKITAGRGRVVSPYFPMRTRMENLNIGFTTDVVEFNDTRIKSGNSSFSLSGKVAGLKRAMLGRGKIGFSGKIVADTINFNQLLKAVNGGMAYMNSSQAYKDSLARESSEDVVEQMMSDSTKSAESALIVLPGNINAHIDLDVKYGVYSNIVLHKIGSSLSMKDRCLKLSDFEATTDAGSMNMNAFYATRSKKEISTGFDLELKDIFIEKFIEATPAIDSLLPMLRSLEGRINCQFAATSQLDTAMNFILPSLKGVARITGDNLVLLDGETFDLIAKKLKFKNKKRNLIDHVSVEMLISENKIEIFPFMMEMDRYRFAMSGTQHLDLSFDYHISVLQSPIPFRLGVTIFGNMDDFDFKIGKARYKNANLPVYTSLIDSTRINLRDQIANIYKIGVEAALKEDKAMQRIKSEKEKNEALIPQEMEALTQKEQQELEQIEPSAQDSLKSN